jgi:hypothetical protein
MQVPDNPLPRAALWEEKKETFQEPINPPTNAK